MNPERLYRHSVQCWKRQGTADRNPELLAKMDELLEKNHLGRSGVLVGRELADLLKYLNQLTEEEQSDLHPEASTKSRQETPGC
jgi:hypothetical protein